MPMCVVSDEGKILATNSRMSEVFSYEGIEGADIFVLTGIKYETMLDATKSGEKLYLERNNKDFELLLKEGKDDKHSREIYIFFVDITALNETKQKYENEKMCLGIVNIDNYDELNSGTAAEKQMAMVTKIDAIIRQWAAGMQAAVIRQNSFCYNLVFNVENCRQQMEAKFPILDEIREIESTVEFPITLSIGVGMQGKSPEENTELAQQALDLAKGRGGDQAVVRDVEDIYYFGGKAQTVEKANKGKSRVIGYGLKKLIEEASKVFIMGHKNPDMDAFGSAMGISRLAQPLKKETYIVVNAFGEALDLLYNEAKKSEEYNIINNKKALGLVDKNSLVIVVDTHKPSMIECPEILDKKPKVVVIDHHRKSEDGFENPALIYLEPYASSTSELVTEILQYMIERKQVKKLEAEGLLAGIFVDTNHFSVKAGVRTFEAAAWLRRAGADLYNVKRLFQVEKKIFMSKAAAINSAEFTGDVAFAVCEGKDEDAQMICSQIADELLMIRGIKMSFAIGVDDKDKTVISARSVGEVNVQVIMERFNGGGHLNTAGAQTDMKPKEVVEKIKKFIGDAK